MLQEAVLQERTMNNSKVGPHDLSGGVGFESRPHRVMLETFRMVYYAIAK